MIFHTVHCHSIAGSLCLKSLVWAEYQLHGFRGNLLRSGLTWNRRLWMRPLTSGGNDSKPASGPKDNILNIYYNFSRMCRLLVPTFFRFRSCFLEVIKFQGPVFYETQYIYYLGLLLFPVKPIFSEDVANWAGSSNATNILLSDTLLSTTV